ncbi:TetR/AcrR family transcriptional regulator [Nocardioides insulae]|uniref:TetR/AcrR family transcriptional regulator n=1 Tax=Nocardioides insulae TaxID=394734 RepID=UPI0004005DB6|nr:TetR/AcrR family transcriptional regulator [Nocardioides insulae]
MTVRAAVGQQAIVDAARYEFAERGYSGASIRHIAQRAGLSLSALYYYYKGKQDLLAAILEADQASYWGACDQALAAASQDPADRLRALVTATVHFRIEHPVKSNIVLSETRSLEPEHLERWHQRNDEASDRFRGIVEDGLEAGLFHTAYAEDARRAIIAMCNAIAQWYDVEGAVGVDELVERYVALALTLVEYRP